jgi:hypothetical protein
MSSTMHRWIAIAALTGAAVSSQLTPATARAELHNITYIARIDGVAPGSQATFVTNTNQTNTAQLSSMPGNAFEANAVLADPNQAGMQVSMRRTCIARSTWTTTSPRRLISSSDPYLAAPTR